MILTLGQFGEPGAALTCTRTEAARWRLRSPSWYPAPLSFGGGCKGVQNLAQRSYLKPFRNKKSCVKLNLCYWYVWNTKELFTHQRTPENTGYFFDGKMTWKPGALKEHGACFHHSGDKNEVSKLTSVTFKYTNLWLISLFSSGWKEREENNSKLTAGSQVLSWRE